MQVTFVLPPPRQLGGIRVIAIYAQRLHERGHEVLLVFPPPSPPSFRAKLKSFLTGNGWPKTPQRGPSFLDSLPVPQHELKRFRPVENSDVPNADVVVATWWRTAAWTNALAPEKGAKAYFMQDYGEVAGQPIDRIRETFHYPMHLITVSPFLERLIHEEVPGAEVDIVLNGVDAERFSCAPRGKPARPTVGFVYSEAVQKGSRLCADAIAQLRRQFPDLRVLVFGAHHSDINIELPKGAEFYSRIPDDQLKDIYGACTVWLFGSRREGFGLPILEAMACRTPVVATPAGAAEHLVDDTTGVLVPHDDPQAMAQAAARIMQLSDDQWRTLSQNCRHRAEACDWDDATQQFEQALRRAHQRHQNGEL